MTTLRLVIDEILDRARPEAGRAAEELGRALLATVPEGVDVVGLVSASPEADYAELARRLPGLAGLEKSALARRELTLAWRRGLAPTSSGMLHAPSLLAPLRKHDRMNAPGTQAVVTLSDAMIWTNPDGVGERAYGWLRAMTRRAERHADALVVPTHAVADIVAEHTTFGDRIRVIPLAAPSGFAAPADSIDRLERMGLPAVYVMTESATMSRHQFAELLAAMATLDAPVVIVGPGDDDPLVDAVLDETGMSRERVHLFRSLDRDDYAAALVGASAFVDIGRGERFSVPILEAFSVGTPVVSMDTPTSREITGDAALLVERSPDFVEGLRDAIETVLTRDDLAEQLRTAGRDRARAFSWRDAAEKVWQLHADL